MVGQPGCNPKGSNAGRGHHSLCAAAESGRQSPTTTTGMVTRRRPCGAIARLSHRVTSGDAMTEETAWEKAASADGTTPSERALASLARKAFLTLWSYPNVFTDEGRANDKGDGKELCDLLVVFGNDVLLFSDKDCAYQSNVDVAVAWPRWYRSAIDKSAKQLAGAEKFIKAFPKRIFLDKACQSPLPIELPDASVARYYLIAVTRGSHFPARQFFGGGSSGSLMLFNELAGKAAHAQTPFHIGFPLESRRFVHVLDEMTVDLVLEELDTVPDLVGYLSRQSRNQTGNTMVGPPATR